MQSRSFAVVLSLSAVLSLGGTPADAGQDATKVPAGAQDAAKPRHPRHHTKHAKRTASKSKQSPKKQVGTASWYGNKQRGKKTASGGHYDPNQMTAASPTLPLGSKAKVTNLKTGQSTDVTITDRGPYTKGRKLDVSRAAAKKLGMSQKGVAPVKIEPTQDAPPSGPTPQANKNQ